MEALDWLRAGAALIATLSLALLGAWAARRFDWAPRLGQPGGARRLRLVESLALDPRRRLVLVRLDGQEHLLLLSAGGDRVVAAQPAPGEAQP